MYVSYRRRGTLTSVFILHYCSSTGTAIASHINIVTSYLCITVCVFLYGLQPLAMATATDCFVFGHHYHCYYVIHICNIEQFENKVTYLLTISTATAHIESSCACSDGQSRFSNFGKCIFLLVSPCYISLS